MLRRKRIAELRRLLDTGADVSVLSMTFLQTLVSHCQGRAVLRDAQGNIMGDGATRAAMVVLEGEDGHQIHNRETRESLALSNVSETLLAFGKLLRKGCKLQ